MMLIMFHAKHHTATSAQVAVTAIYDRFLASNAFSRYAIPIGRTKR